MIPKKIFDEDLADLLTSYNKPAAVYNGLGEYNQAKELLKKSIDDPQKDFQWRSCRCSNMLEHFGISVQFPGRKNSKIKHCDSQ